MIHQMSKIGSAIPTSNPIPRLSTLSLFTACLPSFTNQNNIEALLYSYMLGAICYTITDMEGTEGIIMNAKHYSMNIQWSKEGQTYIVTVPELPGCKTHGDTYEEAVQNA